MLADYKDIVDTINGFIRDEHGAHAGEYSAFPTGCTGVYGEGKPCSCTVEPTWYDEHGCPRYAPHHPSLCPDIYADEIALLEIACQSCGLKFPVQMSAGYMSRRLMAVVWAKRFGISEQTQIDRAWEGSSLAEQIRSGIIHYGDPPRHGRFHHIACCSGDTMNCDDLRVLEFWHLDRAVTFERGWVRLPELEVALPDASEDRP